MPMDSVATLMSLLAMAVGPALAQPNQIPGYRRGDPKLTRSPISLADFELLKKSVLFTDDDAKYLRLAGDVLVPKTEQILDVWYGFVGSNPHLVYYFADMASNQPDGDYLARVRTRFGRWIKDTTDATFDQAWLDWQHEIGLRHSRRGKNKTDGANAVDQVNFRYLVAFIYPISATIRPFLADSRHTPDEVEKMHAAWTKAVVLQTILWSEPYIKDGEF